MDYFAPVRTGLFLLAIVVAACHGSKPTVVPITTVPAIVTGERTVREEFTDARKALAAQWMRNGAANVLPIISTQDPDTLELHFDLRGSASPGLASTIEQCDAHWRVLDPLQDSSVATSRWIALISSRPSATADAGYRHFTLKLAGMPMKGGNYLLTVHPEGEEAPLLARRLMVSEQSVEIDASVHASRDAERMATMQDMELTVRHPTLVIPDPFSDVQVTILQNMRWDEVRTGILPQYVRGPELIYPRPAATFPGGNEWRTLELSDVQDSDQRILTPDARRNIKFYEEGSDHNGVFVARSANGSDPLVSAQHVMITWQLPLDSMLQGGELFVYGAFTGYQCLPEFRCTWSASARSYVAQGLVKQGVIDYAYAWLPDGVSLPDLSRIEGSHARTENDYLVLVYLKDRLVGTRVVNSRP